LAGAAPSGEPRVEFAVHAGGGPGQGRSELPRESLRRTLHDALVGSNGTSDDVGYGIFDDSLGGGTMGTGNTYLTNQCSLNLEAKSLPSGLC
jgi:hypothetical protein